MFRIVLFLLPSVASANHFTFRVSNRISSTDNWLDDVPCVGDHIRFDDTLPVVAFMDHNVDVQSITLPENGILVFTDNGFDFGGDAHWQCAESNLVAAKDVFFTKSGSHDTSFYDPSNWIADEQLFLHMHQVPSEIDDVTISSMSSAQMYLNLPVKVNSFKFYNRERMTTEDFNVLLRSIEGQFQINLARPWAHESDQGGVQRLLAQDAITVVNKKVEYIPEGRVNSNSKNATLSVICEYIKCQGVEGQCIDSFIPFGHCCPVCGTKIELVAMELQLDTARDIVSNVLSEIESDTLFFATFERKTVERLHSEYEIAIISPQNSSFDEDFHDIAKDRILETLTLRMRTTQHQAILDVKIFSSKVDRSIRIVSKVVACLIYFSVAIILVGMHAYRTVDLRVSRLTTFSPVITYHRKTDDVAIEMDHVAEETEIQSQAERENDASELQDSAKFKNAEVVDSRDVEDFRNVNPNFAPDDVAAEEIEMNETCRASYSPMNDVAQNKQENNGNLKKSPEMHLTISANQTEEDTEGKAESKNQNSGDSFAAESIVEDVDCLLNINPNFEIEESTDVQDVVRTKRSEQEEFEERKQVEKEEKIVPDLPSGKILKSENMEHKDKMEDVNLMEF